MEYLTEDEIVEINRRVIALAGEGLTGVLDPNRLNSVVETPKQVFLDMKKISYHFAKSSVLFTEDY